METINRRRIINSVAIIALVAYAVNQFSYTKIDLSTLQPWIVSAFLLALHVWMLQIAKSPRAMRWVRYVRIPAIIVWLLYGFTESFVMIVVGTLVGTIVLAYRHPENRHDYLNNLPTWLTVIGSSIFAGHLSLQLFNVTLPLTVDLVSVYWFAIVFSIAVADVIFIVLTQLATSLTWEEQRQYIQQHLTFDIFIDILSITLPLILQSIDPIAFGIILLLVGAQASQQYRLSKAQSDLLKRLNNMSVINQLGRAISSSIDLKDVTNSVYQELTQLISASTYFIALYDDDQNLISYPLVYHADKRQVWATHPRTEGLAEDVLDSRSTLIIESKNGSRHQQLGLHASKLSDTQFMSTPLMVSEKLIGVLGIGRSDDMPVFDPQDIEVLQTVASQASLALRNANLYERTSRLANNLAEINQSLQDVMFNLDKEDALLSACDIAMSVTNAQQVAIYLLEPSSDNTLQRVQVVGEKSNITPQALKYRPDLFDNGSRFISRKIAPDDTQDVDDLVAYQNVLQIPLRSGNTMIGLIAIYHEDTYHVDDPELDLLQMLSNQITAALDNSDLLQALELYAAEQAQLVHLSRISSSNLDLDRIIQDVCMMLAQIIQMTHVQIILQDNETDLLHTYRLDDNYRLDKRTIALDIIPEFAKILKSGSFNTIDTHYTYSHDTSQALHDYVAGISATTTALTPLHINQQIIGLLLLADESNRTFNDNEFRLIEMAAHQISAQIHNARIHMLTEEALVQRLEQLSLIEEIAQQISQALDPDLIIDNVLDAAMHATHAALASLTLVSNTHVNKVFVIWKAVVDGKVERFTTEMEELGVVAHILETGESVLLHDNREFYTYYTPPGETNYLSTLAVPLIKGETILGVLNLESPKLNFFTNEQASFIRSLAGHAAISIDSARLLEERERQINTLTLLRSLSLETLSLTQQRKIAQSILRTSLIILDGQSAALFTRSHELEAFELLEGVVLHNGVLNDSRPAVPADLIDMAVGRGIITTIPDVNEHPAYQREQITYKHQAVVVIPIQRRHTINEVLCITFDSTRIFSSQDLNTIDLLAVQAAGHLENVTLTTTIQRSNKRMRAILDSTRDGIILLDDRAYIQDANSAAERLLSLPISNGLHESFTRFISEHPDADPILQDMIVHYAYDPDSINDQEYRIGDDENATYIKTLVITVRDNEESITGHLLVLRDITEEKSLEVFQQQLQQMVLHDLRSPLASIVSSMYLSLNIIEFPGDKPIGETLKQTLEVSLDSALYLITLVDTMRELPQLSEMSFETHPNHVRNIAEKAQKTLSTALNESQISVEYDIPDDLPPIDVDSDYIQRVFQNLMHNAYKFTPLGGTIRVTAAVSNDDTHLIYLMVSDTGPGIPKGERERIFGRFVQIDGQIPRTGGKGSGLGLNFCKLTVEGHGGTIWVADDGPLSGATFAFTLPIYDGKFIEREEPPVLDFDD